MKTTLLKAWALLLLLLTSTLATTASPAPGNHWGEDHPARQEMQAYIKQNVLPVVRRWPEVIAVLEGDARAAEHEGAVAVVRAERDGDSAIVAEAERLVAAGRETTVVTADRALADRVRMAGGRVLAPGRLLELLA